MRHSGLFTVVKFSMKLTFWVHRTAMSRMGKGEGRDTERNAGNGERSWRFVEAQSLLHTGLVRAKNELV